MLEGFRARKLEQRPEIRGIRIVISGTSITRDVWVAACAFACTSMRPGIVGTCFRGVAADRYTSPAQRMRYYANHYSQAPAFPLFTERRRRLFLTSVRNVASVLSGAGGPRIRRAATSRSFSSSDPRYANGSAYPKNRSAVLKLDEERRVQSLG